MPTYLLLSQDSLHPAGVIEMMSNNLSHILAYRDRLLALVAQEDSYLSHLDPTYYIYGRIDRMGDDDA